MVTTSEKLGVQIETCIVGEKAYSIFRPSAATLELAGKALGELNDAMEMSVIIGMVDRESRANALSLLIRGDESLCVELSQGSDEELTQGIIKGLSFVEVSTAGRMAGIVKNINRIIAR